MVSFGYSFLRFLTYLVVLGLLAVDCKRPAEVVLTIQLSCCGFRVSEWWCMVWLQNLASGRASYKDGQMEGEARPCAAVKGTQITVRLLHILK